MTPELSAGPRVALVGSSAILLKTTHGADIDAHDDVIRFNRAPVDGFEQHAGSKTTIRTANLHVFANIPFNRWDPKGQPADFIASQKDCRVIYVGPNNHPYWQKGVKELDPSSVAFRLNQVEIKREMKRKFKLDKDPSVGLILTWICLQSGIKPSLYGFGIEETGMTHYWEQRDNQTPFHSFNPERELLKKWKANQRIHLHY